VESPALKRTQARAPGAGSLGRQTNCARRAGRSIMAEPSRAEPSRAELSGRGGGFAGGAPMAVIYTRRPASELAARG